MPCFPPTSATARRASIRAPPHTLCGRSRYAARVLSRYLEMPSARIRFEYGEYGKPDLPAPSRLRFNLSHSEGWAVYAVSLVEVGVDIQAIGRSQDHAAVAGRFFSAREVAELEALPRPEAERAFAACWARKEAYIKARGAGLSIPLSTFDIRGDRRGGDWMAVSGEDTDGWHVRALPSADSYEGAIAARESARVLRFCEWSSL